MTTTLAPHQLRVIEELNQLSEKLQKLETFLGTGVFAGLNPAEQTRLTRQSLIMQLYEQVLSERVSAFKEVA